jgi:hypothetical protein
VALKEVFEGLLGLLVLRNAGVGYRYGTHLCAHPGIIKEDMLATLPRRLLLLLAIAAIGPK